MVQLPFVGAVCLFASVERQEQTGMRICVATVGQHSVSLSESTRLSAAARAAPTARRPSLPVGSSAAQRIAARIPPRSHQQPLPRQELESAWCFSQRPRGWRDRAMHDCAVLRCSLEGRRADTDHASGHVARREAMDEFRATLAALVGPHEWTDSHNGRTLI